MITNQSCLSAGTGTAAMKKSALSLPVPLIAPVLMFCACQCLEMICIGAGSNHEVA